MRTELPNYETLPALSLRPPPKRPPVHIIDDTHDRHFVVRTVRRLVLMGDVATVWIAKQTIELPGDPPTITTRTVVD